MGGSIKKGVSMVFWWVLSVFLALCACLMIYEFLTAEEEDDFYDGTGYGAGAC
jgi:hypothetical protein